MPAPPLKTAISDTYPNPDNATARAGFGALWDYVTGLLGLTGNAPEARAALEVAPRATRIDVASVAGTVNLTTAAPNSDDIRITGALAITAFTVAVGRVFRVIAGGAFTLTNNAAIVTNTGANIVCVSGDSFLLRATAADTVEVISYTQAANLKGGVNAPGLAPLYSARAIGNFNGLTGAIRASGNVASFVRNSVGDYTVTFTTAMSDVNYVPNLTASGGTHAGTGNVFVSFSGADFTTSSFRFTCRNDGSTLVDAETVAMSVYR